MAWTPKCPIHRVEMKLTTRKLPKEQLYQLCPRWGCVQHYREGDLIQYYRGNRAIHEAIVAAAENPALTGLYASVTARIRRARYVTPMTPQRWAFAVKEHEAILDALQRRDGAGLSHILRAHLRHKREEVLQAGFAETEGNDLALRIA